MVQDSVNGTRKTNKNNKSGYTGVSYDNQRKLWVAQITYQRKNHLIGKFKTKEEAIKGREAVEITYFGKYRKKDN